MSVGRLQTQNFQKPPTPVKGEAAPQVSTPAGTANVAEQTAAQKIQQVVQGVGVDVLDAFLKARQGKPPERGLLPSLARLFAGAPAPSAEALQLQSKLSASMQSLGAIYADGLVTEGELTHLHAARSQIRSVLQLADPAVLQMLPKDVREKLQNNLLEPLSVLEQAAGRRANRVYAQVQQRDDGALRERLAEQPTYRHLDVNALKQTNTAAFALSRYTPGDHVAVPRSDGSVQKGVVVGHENGALRVEVLDPQTGALALKNLTQADVARANPLKIGDYLELPGLKLWITDAGPGGVKGKVQNTNGHVSDVDAGKIAQLAISAFSQTQPLPQQTFHGLTNMKPQYTKAVTQALATPQSAQSAQSARSSLEGAQPMQAASSASSVAASSSVSTVRSSRASLEQALDYVWNNQADFAGGKKSVYSDVYNAVVEKNVLTQTKGAFLADLGRLAASRPAGYTSNAQAFGGSGDAISGAVDAWKSGQLPSMGPISTSRLEKTFFRFERGPQWQPEKISQRIYLNAAANHATSVMKFVVQQILDNPQKFPGVEMTKLSGPGAVSERSENIVIYTHGDEASKRVLEAIAGYKAANPSHFMNGVPCFTEQVSGGVATGDEPAIGGGQVSFGSLRADIIEGALTTARHQGLDRAGFGRLVDEGLKRSQIDPSRPHKNLVVSRGLQ